MSWKEMSRDLKTRLNIGSAKVMTDNCLQWNIACNEENVKLINNWLNNMWLTRFDVTLEQLRNEWSVIIINNNRRKWYLLVTCDG